MPRIMLTVWTDSGIPSYSHHATSEEAQAQADKAMPPWYRVERITGSVLKGELIAGRLPPWLKARAAAQA